jgi:phage terminase large subunit
MLVLVSNEKGRPEAQQGSHDDLVMALAIAYYIRPQQKMKVEIQEVEQIQRAIEVEFGFEKEKRDDADSIISVF